MGWLSNLFGDQSKTIRVEPEKSEDEYALAWRNRYLAARIKHLHKKLEKKQIGGFGNFSIADDVPTGSVEEVEAPGKKLAKRVELLESVLKSSR